MHLSGKYLLIAFIILFTIKTGNCQKQYKLATVAFYNVENLFDTINQPEVEDEEYLPEAEKNWDTEKYKQKLENLSKVISIIGEELSPQPPVVLGVSEVENRGVLEDLVKTPKLRPYNYGIVHYNSPDERGIDVALLYQKDVFEVTNSNSVELNFPDKPDYLTRDQLVVSGILDGTPMHFIVNHWPSRYGGEKRSRPFRNKAAKVCRSIVDSIMKVEDDPRIVVMGDFNDDPINESVKTYLNSTGKKRKADDRVLFNPMYKMYKEGIGTLAYRDQWNLFDQLIISEELLEDDEEYYRYYKAKVLNRDFMKQQEGRYKGYPKRTHAGGIYLAGYSDHLPVYMFLVKELDD
jgi:hypothetical protein